MKKYKIISVILHIAIIAIMMNIVKPNFWEQRISVELHDWIFLLFVIAIISLVKLFTFTEEDQNGSEEDQKELKVTIANALLYEKLIITLLVMVLLLFSIGGNKNLSGKEDTPPVILNLEKTIPVDTLKKTDSLKISFPNEINPKKSISSSVQEADTKMSQLKNKGFVHLGQVHSINEKKKWKVTQSYTQYKKDDDFYLNYYSKTINISGLKMLIFDDTNFGNGTISKTPHDYKVIGDIVLVNQGDYEDAWIYIEK